MEGELPEWTDLINFDAGASAQPWDYEENQGAGATEVYFSRTVGAFVNTDQDYSVSGQDTDLHNFHSRSLSESNFLVDPPSNTRSLVDQPPKLFLDPSHLVAEQLELPPSSTYELTWLHEISDQHDYHVTRFPPAPMSNLVDGHSQQRAEIACLPQHALRSKSSSPSFADGFAFGDDAHNTISELEVPVIEPHSPYHGKGMQEPTSLVGSMGAHQCQCADCLGLGTTINASKAKIECEESSNVRLWRGGSYVMSLTCRFTGCATLADRSIGSDNARDDNYWDLRIIMRELAKHERTHFGKPGDYHCLEKGCKTTTKKFADLLRHSRNKHCTNAQKFPCRVIGCKYGGDNGFTREDKLKSHHRNVHQDKVTPGKAYQPLEPKTDGAKVVKGK